MSNIPETDVSRPSALPTHKIIPRANLRVTNSGPNGTAGAGGSGSGSGGPDTAESSKAYLDKVEQEWCEKIDAEVEVLVDGMVDIVGLASVSDKDKFRIALESYQIQTRAESMVRAANSLLSITHSLQLMLLLSDEAQIAQRRDDEQHAVRQEIDETKRAVAVLLDELLRGHPKHGI